MKLSAYLFSGLLLAGVGCAVLFNLIGGQGDDNEILREPFYLVGLGYLFFALGSTGLFVVTARRVYAAMTGHG